MALELVHDGRYAAAKTLFLEAYATEPHYLVLYNVAQAELRLGEHKLAAQHLREFLSRGGDAIDPGQRRAAEEDIHRLESEFGTTPTHDGTQAAASTSRQTPKTQLTQPAASDVSRAFLVPAPHSPSPTPASDTAAPPPWTYALIAGGFAAVGGAVGFYVWNDARYDSWRREDAVLQGLKVELASRGVVPADDPELARRAADNDARLASVERFDPLPLIAGSIGIAAMAVGFWALIDIRDNGAWRVLAGPSGVGVRASF
ncbi:MAG TPA: hypothetical protein VFS67_17545 [Polyangiaceae bacterium]|nr:hypothetical protein [Polyangiaceae bacterium]